LGEIWACPTDSNFFGFSRSTRCGCCSYLVSSISVQRVTCYDHFCVFQFFSILGNSMATAAILKKSTLTSTTHPERSRVTYGYSTFLFHYYYYSYYYYSSTHFCPLDNNKNNNNNNKKRSKSNKSPKLCLGNLNIFSRVGIFSTKLQNFKPSTHLPSCPLNYYHFIQYLVI
jgi:hypothetical protein